MLEGRNHTTKYGKNIMWNVNQVSYLRCAKRLMKPNDEKYATAFKVSLGVSSLWGTWSVSKWRTMAELEEAKLGDPHYNA